MNEKVNRKPSDFDWVSVRGGCSVRQMFEELKLGITQDVAAINKHRRPMSEQVHTFKIVGDNKLIKVFEDDSYSDDAPSVLFVLAGNVIKVKDGETGKVAFDISISLNDEGDCRFTVEGKEQDSWQVRRRALEGIFFRP